MLVDVRFSCLNEDETTKQELRRVLECFINKKPINNNKYSVETYNGGFSSLVGQEILTQKNITDSSKIDYRKNAIIIEECLPEGYCFVKKSGAICEIRLKLNHFE